MTDFLPPRYHRRGAQGKAPASSRCRFVPRLERLEERETPAAGTITAISADVSGGPRVLVLDLFGAVKADFFAYDPAYTGGVSVAVGDVDGDGADDLVTCTRTGVAHVKVFKGVSDGGTLFSVDPTNVIASFFAGLPGGNVTVGNFDGSNDDVVGGVIHNEIAVGATAGAPRVVIFRNNIAPTEVGLGIDPGSQLASFYAYGANSGVGVYVAAGNLDNVDLLTDPVLGLDELITGAGAGGGPHVKVYRFDGDFSINGENLAYEDRVIGSFYAYAPNNPGGVRVAAGNLIFSTGSDIAAEIVTGAGLGASHVKVYTANANDLGVAVGVNPNEVASFYALGPIAPGGVTVGVNILGALVAGAGVGTPGLFTSYTFNPDTGTFVAGGAAGTPAISGIFDLGYLGGLNVST